MCRRTIFRVDSNDRAEWWDDMPLQTPNTDEQEFPSTEYPTQLKAEFLRDFFAETYFTTLPQPVSGETLQPAGWLPCNDQERDAFEDYLREIVDGWTAEEQATVYWYLHASGMTLQKAMSIRRKAGLTP